MRVLRLGLMRTDYTSDDLQTKNSAIYCYKISVSISFQTNLSGCSFPNCDIVFFLRTLSLSLFPSVLSFLSRRIERERETLFCGC